MRGKRRRKRPTVKRRTNIPRPFNSGLWTTARFFSFIRSNLRRLSRKWGPIVQHAMAVARRKYTGPNKKQKWEYQCSCCRHWFLARLVQVDHIEACGSLKSWDDVVPFLKRLLVEVEGLRVLCKRCHHLRTLIDVFIAKYERT